MAPNLKNVVFQNIRNHHTTTTIDKILRKRDGKSLNQTPETAAMVQDWQEISRNRGRRNIEALDNAHEEKKYDVDGMTDEELSRINIYISPESDSEDDESSHSVTKESRDLDKFNEYKHHQYVHRWGLFSDSDGRDEEWFIEDPPVLEENDPQYLCEMCRHIDFQALLSKRGLPGNQQPGTTRISLLGIPRIMDESSKCAFCRLLRRRIVQDDILSSVHPDERNSTSLNLNVLDDGPQYALRLEVEIPDAENSTNSRVVIHQIGEDLDTYPLQGLAVRQDAADISRLQGWLRECNENHQSQDADSTSFLRPQMNTLRVIDTVENCVKEVDTPCEYICLSYVWGTGSQKQYTTKTRDQLSKPGGLDNANLPQTILDAIKVTRELGVRYIWIDALCITQDDNEDKDRIISNMGTIYANATLSIMASTNVNPTDGLPGVGVLRSQKQSTEKIQGITLAVAFQDARHRYSDIENRLWNTRAWTFQERVLSRRSVYFTDSQMCFVCPHGAAFEETVPVLNPGYTATPVNDQLQLSSRLHDVWSRVWGDPTQSRYTNKAFQTEDGITIFVAEDPDRPGEASEEGAPLYKYKAIASYDTIDAPLIKGGTMWEAYAHAVNAYTRRNMTWQSDAVNAFVGIADLIRKGTNTKFWYGMPEFALSQSLLWLPQEPMKRRLSQDGKVLFPSWTWAAWQGQVSYRGRGWHNAVGFPPVTMLMWVRRSTFEECMEDFMQMERTKEEIEDHRKRNESATILLLRPEPTPLLHLDFEERGWEVEHDKVRNQHIFVHEAYPGVRLEYPISLPGQSIIELPSDDGTLYFRARVARARFCDMTTTKRLAPIQDKFLQIGLNDEDRSANNRRPWQRIIYYQGYRAGCLSLNVPIEELNLSSHSTESEQRKDSQESYSLVAISRDGLSYIAPPPIGWNMYWAGDPVMIQEKILRDEWMPPGNPLPVANEDVTPDESKANETGDPQWDEGRFGGVGILDVCNVLLLREMEGEFSERIGVGKISYCAFYAAKPGNELVMLK
ncbi:hypothetical protein FSARC_8405 [Fusarium sarcochroum]|uniref:Heterokaryon incompatibility domain-containing protein n=1 Tax=Fusarium sarcochroum TaxID=1208366 RepID=A0A8H4X703_9HYPO|nr:hypothetical protein FSARC_8405 [Fusarium sarcochroum]